MGTAALKAGMGRFNISNDAAYRAQGHRRGADRVAGGVASCKHAMPASSLFTLPVHAKLQPWYLCHRPRGNWVPMLTRVSIKKKGVLQLQILGVTEPGYWHAVCPNRASR